jgi:hypothetical protein
VGTGGYVCTVEGQRIFAFHCHEPVDTFSTFVLHPLLPLHSLQLVLLWAFAVFLAPFVFSSPSTRSQATKRLEGADFSALSATYLFHYPANI